MKKNKILITGGAGFIGSNIANKLISLGHNVVVLDNLSKQIHGEDFKKSFLFNSLDKSIDFVQGDVTNKSDWEKALLNVEIVLHLAAETGTGQSMYDIYNYTNVNVNGTSLLLDYLVNKSHSVKKVIIASSRAIYGEGKYISQIYGEVYPNHRSEDDLSNGIFEPSYKGDYNLKILPTDENAKLHPSSIYGITKLSQEQLLMTLCESINLPCVAFRYQNVYGPGQSLNNPYTGILSIFSSLLLQKRNLNVFEDGYESRDFVFIDDVVDATLLGMFNDSANFNVFNVGSGIATTILDVAKHLIANLSPSSKFNITNEYRIGDIRHNIADLNKIKNVLGFNPKFSFEDGIAKFSKWVINQEIDIDSYDNSIIELKKRGLLK